MRIFEPTASIKSTDSTLSNSQGLALKAYGFDVKAPTGQRSITFPESSEDKDCSKYVVISASSPLEANPISSTPATSVINLTQRVHWIQRFIIVLTKGPIFLSSTALLFSSKRAETRP